MAHQNKERYAQIGKSVKERGPVKLVAEQNFRSFVNKAFEAAGFSHSAMKQLDDLINQLAKEARQPVKALRIGVEIAPVSRSPHNHNIVCNVVPVVQAYGGEHTPIHIHFDNMPGERGPVDPNFAHNYWKDKWGGDGVANPPDDELMPNEVRP